MEEAKNGQCYRFQITAGYQYAKEAVNRSLEVGIYEGLAHESYLHALTCATEDKEA